MPELEDRLAGLAGAIAWPATPTRLWSGAVGAIVPVGADAAGRRRQGAGWRGRWPLAAAAALLVVAALLAYSPGRDALARWLNLHTTINRVESPPTPSALPSGPIGARLQLGDRTTLAAAQAKLGWRIAVPQALGAPDEVYIKLPPTGPSLGEVSLVYAARPGIRPAGTTDVAVLVTEARGGINEQFFQKTVGPGVTIEDVTVGGRPGYWIAGQPHSFVFVAADGTPYFDSLRLATNTLVFDDGGTVVRIEGDLDKQQAIDIGRSGQ